MTVIQNKVRFLLPQRRGCRRGEQGAAYPQARLHRHSSLALPSSLSWPHCSQFSVQHLSPAPGKPAACKGSFRRRWFSGGASQSPQPTVGWLSSGLTDVQWLKSKRSKVLQLAGSWGCRQHHQRAFPEGQCTYWFSSGRSEFPGNEKCYEAWHDASRAEDVGAWQREMCVSFITGLGLMTPSCPRSLEPCEGAEGRNSLNVSSAPRWRNTPAFTVACQDEVPSWWEHLIRRAESSNDKSGSSCRWLGGIN